MTLGYSVYLVIPMDEDTACIRPAGLLPTARVSHKKRPSSTIFLFQNLGWGILSALQAHCVKTLKLDFNFNNKKKTIIDYLLKSAEFLDFYLF